MASTPLDRAWARFWVAHYPESKLGGSPPSPAEYENQKVYRAEARAAVGFGEEWFRIRIGVLGYKPEIGVYFFHRAQERAA